MQEVRKNAIEVENISFSYDGHPVLEEITFSVAVGEYVGVVGPNGSGKTTLIKIILGLLKPATGQVRIFGTPLEDFRQRFILGYVPQRVARAEVHFPATVEEIVQSGRTARIGMFHRYKKEDRLAVARALEIAGVSDLKSQPIGNLSGGQRQRVFIARALAGEPQILILDEPVLGVDISTQERFYEFLETLNKTHGLTVVFISHDVDVVAHEVQTVLCVNRRLVCHTSPGEFIKGDYLTKLYGGKVKFIDHGPTKKQLVERKRK